MPPALKPDEAGGSGAERNLGRGGADGACDSAAGAAKPYLVIKPRSGWAALDLRELWQYRDLLLTLAIRDVKLRYKQTALGVTWVVLQPLLAAAIFTFVFGKVAKLPSDGLPYFIFAYAGMLGWNAFNSTLTKASACIVSNSQLVSKVYFPRLILPLSTVLSTLLDFLVGLALMVLLSIVYGVNPGVGVLLLPLWLSSYRYRGKAYQFQVNGQTGEVAGARPYSVWKILALALGVLAAGAVVYVVTQH